MRTNTPLPVTGNMNIDIDGLREKIDTLQGRTDRLSWPKTSVQLSTELFILDNNLEDFSADVTVNHDYFKVVTGAFGKSVKGLETLLPNISDRPLYLQTQEIIDDVNVIIHALQREGMRAGSWWATE